MAPAIAAIVAVGSLLCAVCIATTVLRGGPAGDTHSVGASYVTGTAATGSLIDEKWIAGFRRDLMRDNYDYQSHGPPRRAGSAEGEAEADTVYDSYDDEPIGLAVPFKTTATEEARHERASTPRPANEPDYSDGIPSQGRQRDSDAVPDRPSNAEENPAELAGYNRAPQAQGSYERPAHEAADYPAPASLAPPEDIPHQHLHPAGQPLRANGSVTDEEFEARRHSFLESLYELEDQLRPRYVTPRPELESRREVNGDGYNYQFAELPRLPGDRNTRDVVRPPHGRRTPKKAQNNRVKSNVETAPAFIDSSDGIRRFKVIPNRQSNRFEGQPRSPEVWDSDAVYGDRAPNADHVPSRGDRPPNRDGRPPKRDDIPPKRDDIPLNRPPKRGSKLQNADNRPPNTGNKPSSSGNRPPKAGNKPPYTGNTSPNIENRPPSTGNRLSSLGNRFPKAGNKPPHTGNRPPNVENRPSNPNRPPSTGNRPSNSGNRPLKAGNKPPQPGNRSPNPGPRPSNTNWPPNTGTMPLNTGNRSPNIGKRPPNAGNRPPQTDNRPLDRDDRPFNIDYRGERSRNRSEEPPNRGNNRPFNKDVRTQYRDDRPPNRGGKPPNRYDKLPNQVNRSPSTHNRPPNKGDRPMPVGRPPKRDPRNEMPRDVDKPWPETPSLPPVASHLITHDGTIYQDYADPESNAGVWRSWSSDERRSGGRHAIPHDVPEFRIERRSYSVAPQDDKSYPERFVSRRNAELFEGPVTTECDCFKNSTHSAQQHTNATATTHTK